jgi:Glycosyl transferases group 1
MEDVSKASIVEIGDKPFIKQALPDQVTYFSTWPDDDARRLLVEGSHVVSPATFGPLWRLLRDPTTSLVVCHPTFFSPWHWRWITRALFARRALRRSSSFLRMMGPQLLRFPLAAPVAILDQDDLPVINRNNFFLLDRCRLYFKRELPQDRWRVFLKTGHPNLPTPRFRNIPLYQTRIEKLRPISLGIPLSARMPFPEPVEKSVDIFFSGRIEGSSFLRGRGISELMTLREQGGIVIDIAERLPQAEFYSRCARARLTWSPEGLGWDCFRHYEVAACGSVPLMNQSTIERHRPLRQGMHAIYYEVEEGGLTRAVVAALADKPRLEAMARAARAHVLEHHTPKALATHIVSTCVGPFEPESPRATTAERA